MLGLTELRTARVLEWTEIVNSWIDNGEWLEALALALDHYEANIQTVNILQRYICCLKFKESFKYLLFITFFYFMFCSLIIPFHYIVMG